MSRGPARFLSLVATVLGLLLGLEALCRVEREGLAAVAHRVRFKLALLHAKGRVDVVALGTSRSNDGVSPRRLGLGVGFNAATPSSSLPTLEYQAAQLGPAGLVLVEVSRPQFDAKPMDDDAAAAEAPDDGDPLGAWLRRHSALLQLRRAFALENLPRIGALLAAGTMDGSEWFRSRQLLEVLRPETPPEGLDDDAAWRPRVTDAATPSPLDADGERIAAGYGRAVAALRAQGAKVVLVSPPLGRLHRVEECVDAQSALRAELARRAGAPYLDFTCAEVDERWFTDTQHLSTPGRAKYSQVLGELVRALP